MAFQPWQIHVSFCVILEIFSNCVLDILTDVVRAFSLRKEFVALCLCFIYSLGMSGAINIG